jgi:hypothetical protein
VSWRKDLDELKMIDRNQSCHFRKDSEGHRKPWSIISGKGAPKPKVSNFVDERATWTMRKMRTARSAMGLIADSIPNRAIMLWCDSVSLTDFGLISTFETDYTSEVIQHLIPSILNRRKYSTNVITPFYLLRIFVPRYIIVSEPNIYLVVSLTDQWLYQQSKCSSFVCSHF